MDDHQNNSENNHEIPDEAFHSPIAALNVPNHITSMLEQNGFHNVGELIQQLGDDREKILDINGIGPKILEQIEVATINFEPEVPVMEITYHPPPVPTLADFYRPPLGIQDKPQTEELDKSGNTETIAYNAPVPSLADFFDPDNMVVVVETVPLDEFKKDGKPSKKIKKKKASKKAEKSPKQKKKKEKKQKTLKKGKQKKKKKDTQKVKKKSKKIKEKKQSKKKNKKNKKKK